MKTIYKVPITLATLALLVAYFLSSPSFYESGIFHKGLALSVCLPLWAVYTNYLLYFFKKDSIALYWWTVTAFLTIVSLIF